MPLLLAALRGGRGKAAGASGRSGRAPYPSAGVKIRHTVTKPLFGSDDGEGGWTVGFCAMRSLLALRARATAC
jgi:hypothetical protein